MPYHLSSFLAWSLAIQQRRLIAVAAIFMVAGGDAGAAELSLKTVVETLVAARPGNAPDFSGKDLSLFGSQRPRLQARAHGEVKSARRKHLRRQAGICGFVLGEARSVATFGDRLFERLAHGRELLRCAEFDRI